MRNLRKVLMVIIIACFLFSVGWVYANDSRLYDLSGTERSFDEFRGKWLLVNYWATWCVPCLEEIPELNKLHTEHFDTDAVVVGINMEGFDSAALQLFIEEQKIIYPVWTAMPSDQTAFGSLSGMPTSYLISPEGEVVAKHVGVLTAQMVARFITR
jgi:thiol-disulfide isomerase/thioredoxin